MASRQYVLMALSDSHLRAIGKVAAQWSSLEITMLRALSEVAEIEFDTLVLLTGSAGPKGLTEHLMTLTGQGKKTPISLLCKEINDLYAMRNRIVHCDWKAPIKLTPGMGLIGASIGKTKPNEQATGKGIKRRSEKPLFDIALTVREMLAVAKQIAEVERDLLSWKRHWLTARWLAAEPRPPMAF